MARRTGTDPREVVGLAPTASAPISTVTARVVPAIAVPIGSPLPPRPPFTASRPTVTGGGRRRAGPCNTVSRAAFTDLGPAGRQAGSQAATTTMATTSAVPRPRTTGSAWRPLSSRAMRAEPAGVVGDSARHPGCEGAGWNRDDQATHGRRGAGLPPAEPDGSEGGGDRPTLVAPGGSPPARRR